MLAALHEEVQKNTEKFKAPEVTDSEANKTPTAEPFAEKEEPVLDQGIGGFASPITYVHIFYLCILVYLYRMSPQFLVG